MSFLLVIATFISSLVLNQANPRVGDSISFTATYPQDAAKQAHAAQFTNPSLQVNCPDFQSNTIMADKQKVSGGWMSQTYPITIPVSGLCTGTLYYFTIENGAAVSHVLAQTQFEVMP